MGWESLGLIPSPIAGGDGNEEFLLAGRKPLDDGEDADLDADTDEDAA
ncbi:MAG: TlyA family rRNA (cytidine-2'-O)-methyltransferase, partial [Pararhizobium sp.]